MKATEFGLDTDLTYSRTKQRKREAAGAELAINIAGRRGASGDEKSQDVDRESTLWRLGCKDNVLATSMTVGPAQSSPSRLTLQDPLLPGYK